MKQGYREYTLSRDTGSKQSRNTECRDTGFRDTGIQGVHMEVGFREYTE